MSSTDTAPDNATQLQTQLRQIVNGYHDGLTFDEIADLDGVELSAATVRRRLIDWDVHTPGESHGGHRSHQAARQRAVELLGGEPEIPNVDKSMRQYSIIGGGGDD